MRPTLALVLFTIFCLVRGTVGAGLVDNPIVGDSIVYLDGEWTAKSNNGLSMKAKVPGDLITDLQNAGVIGDPIYETTWLDKSQIWDKYIWTYFTNFTYQAESMTKEVLLVFDGVKMGATITLNGQPVGVVADQFLRYHFPVHKMLRSGMNTLEVTFPLTNTLDTEGRFMACTGGWDWAPYSNTKDQHGSNTLSKGIWKSVYMTTVSTVAITHVVPLITYTGAYPTAPLTNANHSGFQVTVNVHMWAPSPSSGAVSASGGWNSQTSQNSNIPAGESIVTLRLTAENVHLWWPAGLGAQNLYTLTVQFTPQSGNKLSTTRRVGFRTFALVTADDSDPSKISHNEGSGTLTMRFRVNGANMWSRGGNMIPMEEFEGRANEDAFKRLLQSAVDANFNTLRIWGGGIFQYDVFYDTADELGLVMYHDMMYAQLGHSPTASNMQTAELKHQVRRLSSHPSILLWDACNECGGQGIYADFVATTVAEEDPSRPIWPSCPAAGWSAGVDQLWGLPNGKKLVPKGDGSPFETHGPYQHGGGWPAVNGDRNVVLFPSNLPPNLQSPGPVGPESHGVYASEFGCSLWSSYESVSPTVSADHLSLHAPPMYQRNYPCDNIIQVYWGRQTFPVGEEALKKQLYQCLLGSTLELKSDIEVRRSGNEWGTVIWQLNEIWPTGGWGTVEYGTPVKGQVIGGRWKPIQYTLKSSVFTDVTSTCGSSANCYVKNDGVTPFTGKVTVTLVHFTTGEQTVLTTQNLALKAGAGVIQWYCASGSSPCQGWQQIFKDNKCANGGRDCILKVQVSDASDTIVSNNVVPLEIPSNMTLSAASVSTTVTSTKSGAYVQLRTNAVAVYVLLTTLAQGRFSDNAILLIPSAPTTISFIPSPDTQFDLALFKSSLRVEHVQQYQ